MPAPTFVSSASQAVTTPNVNNQTMSFTVGSGANRCLVVSAHMRFGEDVGPAMPWTTATYAGQALTEHRRVNEVDNTTALDCSVYIWYLLNPPTGTADVVLNYGGLATGHWAIAAMEWADVLQSSPPLLTGAIVAQGDGNATAPTQTISASTNMAGLSFIEKRGNTAAMTNTGIAGQVRTQENTSSDVRSAVSYVVPAATSLQMGYSWAGGTDVALYVTALQGLPNPPGARAHIWIPAVIQPNVARRLKRI